MQCGPERPNAYDLDQLIVLLAWAARVISFYSRVDAASTHATRLCPTMSGDVLVED
jgi:hypothetical protein